MPKCYQPGLAEFGRYLKFCTVGTIGIAVDMTIFWILVSGFGWGVAVSKASAAEVAILNNFYWNDVWTFAGQGKLRSRARFICLLKFNAVCLAGILWSILLVYVLTNYFGANVYLANLLSIFIVSLWNFSLSRTLGWAISSPTEDDATARRHQARAPRPVAGFTLLELLVVIGVVGLLAGLLLPALSQGKRKADSAKCLNHLRQICMAGIMYASDHTDELPRRRRDDSVWFYAMKPYFVDLRLLKCSRDRPGEWRSYLMNGFNDFWQTTLTASDYNLVMNWDYAHGMRLGTIPVSSGTIIFGEKRKGSIHAHMDLIQTGGNDRYEVAQNMHWDGLSEGRGGGSNFAFADGSVRLLRYGGSVRPINLWAITDDWRNAPVMLP